MFDKKTGAWKLIFTPALIKKLPSELRAEGARIGDTYRTFEGFFGELLYAFSLDRPKVTYAQFLRKQVIDDFDEARRRHAQIDSTGANYKKDLWFEKSRGNFLAQIILGHQKIDEAYLALKNGERPEFAENLAMATVCLGRLSTILELFDEGVYDRIGSIQSALEGASKGGKKSGETRRTTAKLPTPDALRAERDRLIAEGRQPRVIAGILAQTYRCTSDHVRTHLKRE